MLLRGQKVNFSKRHKAGYTFIPATALTVLSSGFCLLTSDFYGGHSKEDPPVPIPNTEVKLFSADGTARATVWESRSPPFFIKQKPRADSLLGAFVVL